MLSKLNLVLRNGLTRAVENDESCARGALVYGANVELFQLLLVELWLVRPVCGCDALEIIRLWHWLWVCADGRGLFYAHVDSPPRG